jgi:hypothetical protein
MKYKLMVLRHGPFVLLYKLMILSPSTFKHKLMVLLPMYFPGLKSQYKNKLNSGWLFYHFSHDQLRGPLPRDNFVRKHSIVWEMRKVKCNIIKLLALFWPQDGAENESSRESRLCRLYVLWQRFSPFCVWSILTWWRMKRPQMRWKSPQWPLENCGRSRKGPEVETH